MTTASGGSDVADFCVNEEGFVKMAKETLSSDVDDYVKRQYIVEMSEAGLVTNMVLSWKKINGS